MPDTRRQAGCGLAGTHLQLRHSFLQLRVVLLRRLLMLAVRCLSCRGQVSIQVSRPLLRCGELGAKLCHPLLGRSLLGLPPRLLLRGSCQLGLRVCCRLLRRRQLRLQHINLL